MKEFEKKLVELLNSESMEDGSDTPGFILANYMIGCLKSFNEAVYAREVWYSRIPTESNYPNEIINDTKTDIS